MLKAQLGAIAAIAAISILAMPSAAAAQDVVPPGNSAVNQYTETFPTSKGQKATRKRGQESRRSPREALGSRNVRRLESEGPAGRELAEVVAETAPPAAGRPDAPHTPRGDRGGDVRAGVGGSSALMEVIRQASGTSDSGGMGVALPLLILAVVLGSALYAWRRRRLAA